MFLDVIGYGYLLLIINNLRNPALNHNPQVPRSNRGFATTKNTQALDLSRAFLLPKRPQTTARLGAVHKPGT